MQASQKIISDFTRVFSIVEAVRIKLRALMASQAKDNQDLGAKYLVTITELSETKFKDILLLKNILIALAS